MPYVQYPFTGIRMLRELLRQGGYVIGRRQVVTLLQGMSITANYQTLVTWQQLPVHWM